MIDITDQELLTILESDKELSYNLDCYALDNEEIHYDDVDALLEYSCDSFIDDPLNFVSEEELLILYNKYIINKI